MVKLAFFLTRLLADLLITNIAKVIIQLGRHMTSVLWHVQDCMMVHSAIKNIINKDYGSRDENSQSMNYL